MRNQDGYTLIELVVAVALMLTVTSGLFAVIVNGLGSSALWSESADLHQRARVAAETLTSEINAAGTGAQDGPLIRYLPVIEPRRRGFAAVVNAITIRYVPVNGAASRLAADLSPDMSAATVAVAPGCGVGTTACGFVAGTDVILYDRSGNFDVATVQSIAPATLVLTNVTGARTVTYPAGSQVAQLVETTLFFDPAERQLRREQAGGSSVPVVDNVVDFQLTYFGDPLPPSEPLPPTGTANCLVTSAGATVPQPVMYADSGGLALLPLSMLTDGPFCGTAAGAYDVDLLRIRSVRVVMRMQTGVDALRGVDPRWFARPGSATDRSRMIPDETLSIDLSPRNLQR